MRVVRSLYAKGTQHGLKDDPAPCLFKKKWALLWVYPSEHVPTQFPISTVLGNLNILLTLVKLIIRGSK